MDAVRDLTRHHTPTRLDVLLPESRLERPPLLPKDFEDLAFVAEHADMVGLSFAESPAGIEALADALRVRTSRPIEAGTTVQLIQAARLSNFLAPRRYGALAGNDGR